MNHARRWLIGLVFVVITITACSEKKAQDETQIGKAAPAFILKDLNGAPFSFDKMKGRVILVRFWATRCDSCRIEMPKLENSHRNMLQAGFMVISVNVEDPVSKAAEFANELKITFPVLIDENKEVTKLYQVYGVPTSFIIDRSGIIRERIFGDLDEELIQQLVSPYL